MGKTSYKSTSELIQTLAESIDNLNHGKLNVAELDHLVDTSRDLYELLVVLRFKAFDGELITPSAKTQNSVSKVEEDKDEPLFDFSEMNDEKPKEEEEMGFDFTLNEEENITTVAEVAIEEDETKAIEKIPSEDETIETANSLNDLFKEQSEVSLRKKFQNSPVENIKNHISIAKKFEYISIMFDGDAEAYNQNIDLLNNYEEISAARKKMDELSQKYEWNLEDTSIIKFIELVERRYL